MERTSCGGRSLSVARNCPYSDNEENCRYEIFTWVPRLNKCSNCERFLKKRFPNIDTSSYNIDENGNVLREVVEMKEVTYEDWQKNPTPRMMWVWNSNVENKVQAKVIYVIKSDEYPVITANDVDLFRYKHCAEIKKQRRMTNKELARWLREKPTRECKSCNRYDNFIYCYHTYFERCANEEVDDLILIREDDSEWREPLVEVEE